MKKFFLLVVILIVPGSSLLAQDSVKVTWPDCSTHVLKPIATFTTTIGAENNRSFYIGSYKELDFYAVDWGDGVITLTDSIKYTNTSITKACITGKAKDKGEITIYAEDTDAWYFGTSLGDTIKALDISGLSKVQQLSIGTAAVETIDVSALDSLRIFNSFNGILTTIDFSHNSLLSTINVAQNKIASLDLSYNTILETLTAYNNALTSLDLSKNRQLETVTLYSNGLTSLVLPDSSAITMLNVSTNQLTSLDFSKLPKLKTLNTNNNKLTTLELVDTITTLEAENNLIEKVYIPDAKKSCKLAYNNLTLATLPAIPSSLNTTKKIKKFIYAPQADFTLADTSCTYSKTEEGAAKTYVYDLSSQDNAIGIETTAQPSTFTFIAGSDTLKAGTDYTLDNDIVTFLKDQDSTVVMTVESNAFPLFTGEKVLKTEPMTIAGGNLIKLITATAEVNTSSELYFNLGTYKDYDKYVIDWGDGTLVGTDSVKNTNSKLTKVAGKAAGNGIITLYSDNKDLWYLGIGGAQEISALDLSNAANVQQLNISNCALSEVDVSKIDSLRVLTVFKSGLTSLDVTNNTLLTSIAVNQNNLTKIDLSKNINLESLQLMKNSIKNLDLSSNTKLTGMGLYANGNGLEDLKIGDNTLTLVNLSDNNLTEFDAAKYPNLKTLYLANNQVSALDFSQNDNLSGGDLYISGNKLTKLDISVPVGNLDAKNNQIAAISLNNTTKSCYLSGNALTIATLPTRPSGLSTTAKKKKFTYFGQAPLSVDSTYSVGDTIDLSAQNTATGVLTEAVATEYFFVTTNNDTLLKNSDYEEISTGIFKLLKAQSDSVFFLMRTEAFPFPDLTGNTGSFTTSVFNVSVSFDINSIGEKPAFLNDCAVYNLNGQKVDKNYKGIVIRRGKKIITR